MRGDPATEVTDEIRLTLPALASYARVARLAVTGLASRLGFSYDEIEDLRIAVGEISGLLVDEGDGRLTYRCAVTGDGLAVEATREPGAEPAAPSELTRQILASVLDEVHVDDDRAHVRALKRRRG